jgi:hypothetical protein
MIVRCMLWNFLKGWMMRVMRACRKGATYAILLSGMPGHVILGIAAYLHACHLSYLDHHHHVDFKVISYLSLSPVSCRAEAAGGC